MSAARQVPGGALLLLPGGLVVYFAFNSGGYYAGAPAYIAVLLCLVLAVRVAFAQRPFAGMSRFLGAGVGAMGLYALITLVSGWWSHAPGQARVEFGLPLVYVLAMLLFGSIARTRERIRWVLRGLALACFVVCGCGLITRLLPHVWPTSAEIANNRLSFPVTYWNVLGLVAAVGIVLCVHLSSDLQEHTVVRSLTAAAVPILACTLYFTFSRGAIGTCIIVLVVYVLVARPGAVLGAVGAIAPATAVAVKVAYDANLLATFNPSTSAAVRQGHHVAVVVVACAIGAAVVRILLSLAVDARLSRVTFSENVRRRTALVGWSSLAVATVIAVIALNGTIVGQYHRFTSSHLPGNNQADLRSRLTDPANDNRLYAWKIAWRQFKAAPVHGHGAGTYVNAWARYRPIVFDVQDAHSLYLETLDELGVVGFVLLMIAILTVLVRTASRCRGSGRPLYAAVFAVLLAWAIHAGVDWDWEMPVVSIIFFSLGGFMLARREKVRRDEWMPVRGGARPFVRIPVAVAFLLLAVLPAYTWASQRDLDNAAYAFAKGDCAGARQAARSSITILGNRPEPYEILGYCDLRLGMPRPALAAINKAVSLDPNNWTYRYDSVLISAADGRDPQAALRTAYELNPLEPLVQQARSTFTQANRRHWIPDAEAIASTFSTL